LLPGPQGQRWRRQFTRSRPLLSSSRVRSLIGPAIHERVQQSPSSAAGVAPTAGRGL
jgi:hypothetical protein